MHIGVAATTLLVFAHFKRKNLKLRYASLWVVLTVFFSLMALGPLPGTLRNIGIPLFLNR